MFLFRVTTNGLLSTFILSHNFSQHITYKKIHCNMFNPYELQYDLVELYFVDEIGDSNRSIDLSNISW